MAKKRNISATLDMGVIAHLEKHHRSNISAYINYLVKKDMSSHKSHQQRVKEKQKRKMWHGRMVNKLQKEVDADCVRYNMTDDEKVALQDLASDELDKEDFSEDEQRDLYS